MNSQTANSDHHELLVRDQSEFVHDTCRGRRRVGVAADQLGRIRHGARMDEIKQQWPEAIQAQLSNGKCVRDC
jgi:hypothetical protein